MSADEREVGPRVGRSIDHLLYRVSLSDPQLLPSGERLSFLRRAHNAARSELVICDVAGAGEQVLVDGDIAMGGLFACGSYCWSGDEKVIAALTRSGMTVRYDLEVGEVFEVADSPNATEIVTSRHGDVLVTSQRQGGFIVHHLPLGSVGDRAAGGRHVTVETYEASRWVDAEGTVHAYDFMTSPRLTPTGEVLFGLGWRLDTRGVSDVEFFSITLSRASMLTGTSWHRSRGSLLAQPILLEDGTVALLAEHEGRWAPYHLRSPAAPLRSLRRFGGEGDFGDVSSASVQRTWAMDQRSVVGAVNLDGFGALVEVMAEERQLRRGVFGSISLSESSIVGVRSGARAGSSIFCASRHDGSFHTLRSSQLVGFPSRQEVEPEVIRISSTSSGPECETALGSGASLVARVFHTNAVHRGTVVLCNEAPEAQERVVPSPMRSALLDRGISVIYFDARGTQGHGRAHREALLRDYGAGDLVDYGTLLSWVSRPGGFGEGLPVVLIGRSLGAWTALMVERRFGGFLDAVVLVDPVLGLGQASRSGLRTGGRLLTDWLADNAVSDVGIVDEFVDCSGAFAAFPEARIGRSRDLRVPGHDTSGDDTPILVLPVGGRGGSDGERGQGSTAIWTTPWPGSFANEESSFFDAERLEAIVVFVLSVVAKEPS